MHTFNKYILDGKTLICPVCSQILDPKTDTAVSCGKCGKVVHKQCSSICDKTISCATIDKMNTVKVRESVRNRMLNQSEPQNKLNNDLEKQIEGIVLHQFVPSTVPWLEVCDFCGEKILNPFNSAFQCKLCNKYAHKSCRASADTICPCLGYEDESTHPENQALFFKLANESKKPSRERVNSFFSSLLGSSADNTYTNQQSIAHGDESDDDSSVLEVSRDDESLSTTMNDDDSISMNSETMDTFPSTLDPNMNFLSSLSTIRESYRLSQSSLTSSHHGHTPLHSPYQSFDMSNSSLTVSSNNTDTNKTNKFLINTKASQHNNDNDNDNDNDNIISKNPYTDSKTISESLKNDNEIDNNDTKATVLAQKGFLTVLIHEATDLPLSNSIIKLKVSPYCKVTLNPWHDQSQKTYPDTEGDKNPHWEGKNNVMEFYYPGAMAHVNPLLFIQIKGKKQITNLINNVIATVSIPLYIILKNPGIYNEGWFNINKDGVRTEGKIHLSIFFEPDKIRNSIVSPTSNIHLFRKVNIDDNIVVKNCYICKQTLITGFGGIVNHVYKCSQCGIYCHAKCRERANAMFLCNSNHDHTPTSYAYSNNDIDESNEPKYNSLSDLFNIDSDMADRLLKILREQEKVHYSQSIGQLHVDLYHVSLYHNLKRRNIHCRLYCNNQEHRTPTSVSSYIPSYDCHFNWKVYAPSDRLKVEVRDNDTDAIYGYFKINISDIQEIQAHLRFARKDLYNWPLDVYDAKKEAEVLSYSLLKKNQKEPVGVIEMRIYYMDNVDGLLTDSVPQFPRLPDLTLINANYYWLRFMDILASSKSFIDFYMYVRSWENSYLSLCICLLIVIGCCTIQYDYLHVFLLCGLVVMLFITYFLRKYNMMPRIIQNTEFEEIDSLTGQIKTTVTNQYNIVKNSLAAGFCVMLASSYGVYYYEKIYNIITWSHPEVTREIIIYLLFAIIAVMLIPFRFLLMGGLLTLVIPNNLPFISVICRVLNLINSLPSDDDVLEILNRQKNYPNNQINELKHTASLLSIPTADSFSTQTNSTSVLPDPSSTIQSNSVASLPMNPNINNDIKRHSVNISSLSTSTNENQTISLNNDDSLLDVYSSDYICPNIYTCDLILYGDGEMGNWKLGYGCLCKDGTIRIYMSELDALRCVDNIFLHICTIFLLDDRVRFKRLSNWGLTPELQQKIPAPSPELCLDLDYNYTLSDTQQQLQQSMLLSSITNPNNTSTVTEERKLLLCFKTHDVQVKWKNYLESWTCDAKDGLNFKKM